MPEWKARVIRIFDQEENEMETIEIKLPDYLAKKLPQEESVIQRVLELGLKQLGVLWGRPILIGLSAKLGDS